ncbi:M24 family metallopeptidase [Parafrigoribacterium soli]|uniref:M24 family metallopeptidase n=1 Tax=Parafrigoribacterium soli TaxID=3144663 RepID=UPI0032ECC3FA
MSTASPHTDRPAKLARLQQLMDDRSATALHLTTPEMLAWFFDGPRVAVPYAGAPVFSAIVRRGGEVTVTALANEIDRLRDEELGGDLEFHSVPWHEQLPAAEPGVLRDVDLVGELRAARASLLPVERARYLELGAEVTRAMSAVLREATPDETEHELAAELAAAIVALGAEPVVLLVAGEQRTGVQHPLPTGARLGRRAMAVVGARRRGLVVNLTRWVEFDDGESPTNAALREVEADAFAATRPGRELREVLADIAAAYERHGFGAETWLRHHQGGPTGYLGRDPKATPASRDLVVAGHAFAWNPSIAGAKLEDTVIVDGDRIELVTVDPDWPTVDVRGLPRPLALTP